MAGYTEGPAFFQFFQIVMAVVSIGFQSFAFSMDNLWNTFVKTKDNKVKVCSLILEKIDPKVYYNFLNLYNISKHQIKTEDDKTLAAEDKVFFESNILRDSLGEKTCLALESVIVVILITHLCFACWSTNYDYRTTWTAVAQGTVIFLSGFTAIIMAISAHKYDDNYDKLAARFKECNFLLACSNGFPEEKFKNLIETSFHELKDKEDTLKKLFPFNVCQQFQMKQACAAIAGVNVLIGFLIICKAMDLTTIYDEEDVDEEERARRQNFHLTMHEHNKGEKASEPSNIVRASIANITIPDTVTLEANV